MPSVNSNTTIVTPDFYLTIDPGKKGGIAWYQETLDGYDSIPMPETELDIWNCIRRLPITPNRSYCYIESVGARPGQGVTSMFNFGMQYGSVRMAATAAGFSIEYVHPTRWQKEFMLSKKKDEPKAKFKKRICERAKQILPNVPHWDGYIKDQLAVCDALLMVEWVRRLRSGTLKHPDKKRTRKRKT